MATPLICRIEYGLHFDAEPLPCSRLNWLFRSGYAKSNRLNRRSERKLVLALAFSKRGVETNAIGVFNGMAAFL